MNGLTVRASIVRASAASSVLRPAARSSFVTRVDFARSMPGFRNSKRLASSPRWFSTGVPVSARRWRACSSVAAFAAWLDAFLIAWASSRMT